MTRVYGVEIENITKALENITKSFYDLTHDDKVELAKKYSEPNGDVYTLDAWFHYLNQDGIDTENYFWFPLDI